MAELYPVSGLQDRYNLKSRQAVYDRLDSLGIKPVTRGKLSAEQLSDLDDLQEWLKANPNGSIADFPRGAKVVELTDVDRQAFSSYSPATSNLSTGLLDKSDNFDQTLMLVESIARQIAANKDPLQHYASLERAIASGWLLSSSEVRSLIGTKPTGDRYQRGSFIFVRSGKVGAQSAWRVTKVVNGGSYQV
jgi:hypothetical protein